MHDSWHSKAVGTSCPSLMLSSICCFPTILMVLCHLGWHFGQSVCPLVSLGTLQLGCQLDPGCSGDFSVVVMEPLAQLNASLDCSMSWRRDSVFMNLSCLVLSQDPVAVSSDSLFTMGVSLHHQSLSDLRSGFLPVNAFMLQ
jgi:hypothetical protein